MMIFHLTLTASLVVEWVSAAIPWVVAFLVHIHAPGWVKSLTHVVLAALTAAVGVLAGANGGYDVKSFLQAFLYSLVVSGMSYVVVTRKIGGPQLEAAGLSLGKSLIMDITKGLPTDEKAPVTPAVAVTALPQDQTPPTGNVTTVVPPKEGQ